MRPAWAGAGTNWPARAWPRRSRCEQIKHNEALLRLIRARLHLIAGRREDRLVFDLQTAVAESFGYRSRTTPDGRPGELASEALMKRYYWAAKAVTQLNQILLLNIEERLNGSRGTRRCGPSTRASSTRPA